MPLRYPTDTRWRLLPLALIVIAYAFWPAISFTLWVFGDTSEDMAYGWVIPLIVGAIVWKRRDALRCAAERPSLMGAISWLIGLLFFWIGSRGNQQRFLQLALVWMVWAVPYAFWGWRVAKLMIYPACYSLLIIPLSFLDAITFPLRLASSWVSVALLNGFGIEAKRIGTALVGANFQLDVADPCSGIRSLVVLLALTAGYAGIHRHFRWWTKALLVASALPLAFLGNIIRLTTTAVACACFDQEIGMYYHDQAGYLTFPLVMLIVLVLVDYFSNRQPAPPLQRETPIPSVGWISLLPIAAMMGIFLTGSWFIQRQPPPDYESDSYIAQTLPDVPGFNSSFDLHCQNPDCLLSTSGDKKSCPLCGGKLERVPLAELTILPSDTRFLKCNYTGADGVPLRVSVLVSGRSRMSIHRPEMCLPGQGYTISDSHVVEIPLADGSTVKANCVTAARLGEPPVGLLYWFENPHGSAYAHYERIFSDIWARTVHNRMIRWSAILIMRERPYDEAALEQMAQFLSLWRSRVVRRP